MNDKISTSSGVARKVVCRTDVFWRASVKYSFSEIRAANFDFTAADCWGEEEIGTKVVNDDQK